MRPTSVLWRSACRITLFTRENCSLCTDARSVLNNVFARRPFEYDVIDVMAPRQEKWKAVYEFDTPVVHADRVDAADAKFTTTTEAAKLMHRFREQEVEKLMDSVMTG